MIGDEERSRRRPRDAIRDARARPRGRRLRGGVREHWSIGRHCVAVNSGTSALHMAFLAAGIGPGDEVIVPSFRFAATANCGRADRGDSGVRRHRDRLLQPRPGRGRGRDHPRTAAIMPVHLYGHPADMARSPRSPSSTASPCSRMRPRRTARRSTGCPSARSATSRILLVLSDQEHDLGRGRHGHHRRPGHRSGRSGCCATRAWRGATRTKWSASTPG